MPKEALFMKKAQGLPLNTIVIAIIVVTVLVVLIMIFTGGMGRIITGLTNCQSKANHQCMSSCTDGWVSDPSYKCLDADKKPIPGMMCCVKTQEEAGGFVKCSDAGGKMVNEEKCIVGGEISPTRFDESPAPGQVCCTTSKVCEGTGKSVVNSENECTTIGGTAQATTGKFCCTIP